MQPLSSQNLGHALRIWRAKIKKIDPNDVVENSKKDGKATVSAPNISNIENHGKGFSYDHLVQDVFPAYGIQDICDFDIFLDSCSENSIDAISVIRLKEDIDEFKGDGTKEMSVSPLKLKENRTRISILEIDPGKRTIWQNHEGHEYVMIGKGKVRVEFAEAKDASDDKKTCFDLSEGDGVAFPSIIFHSFINTTDGIAQLIIARPTKSLPKGMSYKQP